MKMLNCVQQGVVALYPFYGDHGENETRIQLTTTTVDVDCAISNVLTQLADCYDKTLENMRRTASHVTGYNQYHPLYFCSSLILIPVKHRKPYGRCDGSMAYINHYYIQDVLASSKHATIYFMTGSPPYVCPLARATTVQNKQGLADTLRQYYQQLGA